MIAAGSTIPTNEPFRGRAASRRAGSERSRLRGAASLAALVLLPCLLVQACVDPESKTRAKGDLLMRPAVAKGDLLVPRAEMPSRTAAGFDDRFRAVEALAPATIKLDARERTASVPSGAYRVASLSPEMPREMPAIKQAQTHLIGFENSAFPYRGTNPRSGISTAMEGGRYGDNRVLVHVPRGFDAKKPGVIVVFFHGHGATLERDVRDRQLLPQQISDSGVNAVLIAPQLAVDAADSSAGKFWERGGFKRFMAESAEQLARVYGDARAAQAFAKMPVVVVAYSGGYLTAAYALHVGGVGNRVRGVILLDALYGELDKFAGWLGNNPSAFLISSYTRHLERRNDDLARLLNERGFKTSDVLKGPLKPGTVAFLPVEDGIRHRDFVTNAWAKRPVRDALLRMAQNRR